MKTYIYGALAVIAALVVGLIALFVVQNAPRTTQLTLEVWFLGKFGLADPVSIPALMGICIGGGFLVGLFPMVLRGASQARRIRQLEQQLALGDGGSEWK